jgi:polar amino acid transport system substrate-binding protein
MRRVLVAAAVLVSVAGLAACGPTSTSSETTSSVSSGGGVLGASCTNAAIQKYVVHKGQLRIATDDPVYVPWFYANRPENRLGYEAATAYAVAQLLGFSPSEVHWNYEPFDESYAPGPKNFDFDINEISVTAARSQVVTFSVGYFNDNQALVVLKNGPVVKNHSPAALKKYVYGDQIGTTSLAYINQYIQPTTQPKVYSTLNDVKEALTTNQIQAFVTDTPTAQYIASSEGTVALGQFPSTGEHFGMLLQKGDQLVTCLDKAIEHLKTTGVLAHYEQVYLKSYLSIPTIKP